MESLVNAILNTVPISQFNRGLAGQIFEEIKKTGPKLVIKNNVPEAVIMSTKDYLDMMEVIHDYQLYMESMKRIQNIDPSDLISHEDVIKNLNITEDKLEGYEEVELE